MEIFENLWKPWKNMNRHENRWKTMNVIRDQETSMESSKKIIGRGSPLIPWTTSWRQRQWKSMKTMKTFGNPQRTYANHKKSIWRQEPRKSMKVLRGQEARLESSKAFWIGSSSPLMRWKASWRHELWKSLRTISNNKNLWKIIETYATTSMQIYGIR